MLAIVVYTESIASAIVKMSYFLVLTLIIPSQKKLYRDVIFHVL